MIHRKPKVSYSTDNQNMGETVPKRKNSMGFTFHILSKKKVILTVLKLTQVGE